MAFNGGNCGEIKMQKYVIKNVNKLNSEKVKVTEERLWLLCTQNREKPCDKESFSNGSGREEKTGMPRYRRYDCAKEEAGNKRGH